MKKIIVLLILCLTYNLFGQTTVLERQRKQILSKTDTTSLQNFAQSLKIEYSAKRNEVINWAKKNGCLVKGKGFELQEIRDGKPIYYVINNRDAAQTVSTDIIWSGGSSGLNLDGTGIYFAIWDGGSVYDVHNSFIDGTGQHHAFFIDSPGIDYTDHATHVAGTMIANDRDYNSRGMADNSILFSFDWNNDAEEMTIAAAGMNENIPIPLILSNHSYGPEIGWDSADYRNVGYDEWYWLADDWQIEDDRFGNYDSTAWKFDKIARDAPYYTIILGAGNQRGMGPAANTAHWVAVDGHWTRSTAYHPIDGWADGFNCLFGQNVAKNVIVVGAVDDIPWGYNNPGDVLQENTSFSSSGPTSDGRIKPDIVANGDDLKSTLPNNTFGNMSGTSMAAPNVTGSIALLLQHYQNTHNNTIPLSSTIKSIIIHTADESGPNIGPDYKFGWGLFNAASAAELITKDQISPNTIQELSLHNGSSYTQNSLPRE